MVDDDISDHPEVEVIDVDVLGLESDFRLGVSSQVMALGWQFLFT